MTAIYLDWGSLKMKEGNHVWYWKCSQVPVACVVVGFRREPITTISSNLKASNSTLNTYPSTDRSVALISSQRNFF